MRSTTKAKYLLSGCDRRCKLHEANLPPGIGQQVHTWYEQGTNNPDIRARLLTLGVKIAASSIGRHKMSHLHPAQVDLPADDDANGTQAPEQKLSELEILDKIIQRGGQRMGLSTTVVTTEHTLSAIGMKQKLTEGNVFDDMFNALFETEDDDMSDLIPSPDPALNAGPHEDPEALESTDEDPPK
jgi:hypothetical protein